jgi:hypothetical protein
MKQFAKKVLTLGLVLGAGLAVHAAEGDIPGATELQAAVTAGKNIFASVAVVLLAIAGFTIGYKMLKKVK